jgi:hypothetical protein
VGPPLAPTPHDTRLYTVSGTVFEIVAQRPVPIQSRVTGVAIAVPGRRCSCTADVAIVRSTPADETSHHRGS